MKFSLHAAHPRYGIAPWHVAFLVLLAFLISSGSASAVVQTISYSNGIDPPIVVCDGDTDDLDDDDGEIKVLFNLADGAGDDWVASGIILATITDPAGATLVVTETTIQNITGQQIIAAHIIVNHDMLPFVSLTSNYSAHIDGSFDKIGGGSIGNFILNFNATITGMDLGGMNFMGGLVIGPILFDWTGLPKHQDTILNQNQTFVFYMDELDNTINLFDSATILPTSPIAVEEVEWGTIKWLFR